MEALTSAGVHVVKSPADIGAAVQEALATLRGRAPIAIGNRADSDLHIIPTIRPPLGVSQLLRRGRSVFQMTPSDFAVPRPPRRPAPRRIVNDFSIQVATVNGSGSQTANLVLLRAIFQMGVPVSGKNMFPSNIAGPAYLVHHPRQQGRLRRDARRKSTSWSR